MSAQGGNSYERNYELKEDLVREQAAAPRAVPAGMVLVPREPTEAMRRAIYMALHFDMSVQNPDEWGAVDKAYSAMLAALPGDGSAQEGNSYERNCVVPPFAELQAWSLANGHGGATDNEAYAAWLAAQEVMTRAEIEQWIDACNHEPARATLRHYLRLREMPGTTGQVPEGGIALIAAERQRQITEEGWTPKNDDEHACNELAAAAACYAAPETLGYVDDEPSRPRMSILAHWPWALQWWKPGDRIRELTKAGALIAAEIDRLLRAAVRTGGAQ